MKNKGRKHKAGIKSGWANRKSNIVHITRPVESMSPKGMAEGRFDKKKWTKRVRGYNKSAIANAKLNEQE